MSGGVQFVGEVPAAGVGTVFARLITLFNGPTVAIGGASAVLSGLWGHDCSINLPIRSCAEAIDALSVVVLHCANQSVADIRHTSRAQ